MFRQLKMAVHICKCMLTDVNLGVKIVKDNNKFHKNLSRNNLQPFMPKKPQSSQTRFQNLTANILESD